MYQKDSIQVNDAKARASQLHLATRMDRRDNHYRLRVVNGREMLVSMLSLNGCFICQKTQFEILDGVGGEKCNPKTAIKASFEPTPGKGA